MNKVWIRKKDDNEFCYAVCNECEIIVDVLETNAVVCQINKIERGYLCYGNYSWTYHFYYC